MKTRVLLVTATAIAAIVSQALAQDSAPAKPAMSASMPMDCKMTAQGGEGAMQMGKEMHMGKDMPCAGEQAVKSVKPAKAKPPHDHAKFHKNQ